MRVWRILWRSPSCSRTRAWIMARLDVISAASLDIFGSGGAGGTTGGPPSSSALRSTRLSSLNSIESEPSASMRWKRAESSSSVAPRPAEAMVSRNSPIEIEPPRSRPPLETGR